MLLTATETIPEQQAEQRILVVGDGFLGGHVAAELAGNEYNQVTTTTRHAADEYAPNGSVKLDIQDADQVARVVNAVQPHAIVMTAGSMCTAADGRQFYDSLGKFDDGLLKSDAARLARVLFVGSAKQYCGQEAAPLLGQGAIPETAPKQQDVLTDGGRKSYEAALLTDVCRSIGARLVTAVMFNPVGAAGFHPSLATQRGMPPYQLLSIAFENARAGRATTVNRDRRAYLHASDAGRALAGLADPRHALNYEQYNIGGTRPVSNRALVRQLVVSMARHNLLVAPKDELVIFDDAYHPYADQADVSRLQANLGWRQKYSWKQAVHEFVAERAQQVT